MFIDVIFLFDWTERHNPRRGLKISCGFMSDKLPIKSGWKKSSHVKTCCDKFWRMSSLVVSRVTFLKMSLEQIVSTGVGKDVTGVTT